MDKQMQDLIEHKRQVALKLLNRHHLKMGMELEVKRLIAKAIKESHERKLKKKEEEWIRSGEKTFYNRQLLDEEDDVYLQEAVTAEYGIQPEVKKELANDDSYSWMLGTWDGESETELVRPMEIEMIDSIYKPETDEQEQRIKDQNLELMQRDLVRDILRNMSSESYYETEVNEQVETENNAEKFENNEAEIGKEVLLRRSTRQRKRKFMK